MSESEKPAYEEGIWPCTVISGTFGENEGSPQVQINVKITDGPSKGKYCTYEDQVNGKSALYISRSCSAVGWRGHNLATLSDDIAEWIKKTGGATTVEIKHIELKRGKKYDKWIEEGGRGKPPIWAKANAIGRGNRPLTPPSKSNLDDANDAMRRAMEADGTAPQGGPPPDDVPHAGGADDDIPF